MEELRKKLNGFIEYDEAVIVRKQIRAWAISNYRQRYHNKAQMGFIKRHEISTEAVHPQSSNHLYYYQMFSVITQHIYADTIEELFDKALDIENFKNAINI